MTTKAKRTSTKKVVPKKAVKKTVTKAKAKVTTAARKVEAVSRPKSQKVDYYPNRMTVAVSALAGTILVLVAVIAVLGSRS